MHPARLFLLCGLPGAGKTTRATEIERRFGVIRMSADDEMQALGIDLWDEAARARIEARQRQRTAELLRAGTGVVVEWGAWSRRERDELRTLARAAGARAHLEHLDAPIEVLWERVRDRGREQRLGARAITLADLERWSAEVERPDAEELARYDPMPPVRAGAEPGTPAYPYGTWLP